MLFIVKCFLIEPKYPSRKMIDFITFVENLKTDERTH